MEIDGFEDVDVFKKRIDEWISVFRNTRPAPGHQAVLIPGDPEHEAEGLRTKYGIPLIQAVVNDLKEVSKITGVAFEIPDATSY
jgi:LDH2 family malate/lactate/ureidoglycolate dehydrogenase